MRIYLVTVQIEPQPSQYVAYGFFIFGFSFPSPCGVYLVGQLCYRVAVRFGIVTAVTMTIDVF